MDHAAPSPIIHLVLLAGVAVAGLVFLVVKLRRGSRQDPASDSTPDPSDPRGDG